MDSHETRRIRKIISCLYYLNMVTYSDLFQYSLVIIGIVALIIQIFNSHNHRLSRWLEEALEGHNTSNP